MKTNFTRIVVIGYGKAAGEVLKYIHDRRADYGYELAFIEHEPHALSITGQICRERGIPFASMPDKRELADYLAEIQEKTLIVSASNNFLFPAALVEKENITIINFHNALLPDYPGRNAPSWVIYRGEERTGITWHYVTAGVDEGNIIIQKSCEIGSDTKAYELTERLMDLACEGFYECFDGVMQENVKAKPQEMQPGRRMYRSTEIPGDGFLNLAEEPEKLYRLLRSVDYGKSGIFPPLQTEVAGVRAEILRYRKIAPEKRKEEADMLHLPLADGNLLKIKYCMLEMYK
ncbi:MAG: hypothetical protein K2H37_02610 [Lachnospiraceae bacterium]|nr:hypothetical protein [Lachnospiraceae bacterium]